MILYLIRHAAAKPPQDVSVNPSARPSPNLADNLDRRRPLTSKGRKRMSRIARGLKSMQVQIDQIVTSPYLRASQTAEILARRLSLGDAQLAQSTYLAPDGDLQQLVHEILDKYRGIERLALVGHEPSLSNLLSILVTGEPSMQINLKKGSVCRLSVEDLRFGRCAALEWHLTPSQLEELAS
jgi:phosphohistidine phosphatase